MKIHVIVNGQRTTIRAKKKSTPESVFRSVEKKAGVAAVHWELRDGAGLVLSAGIPLRKQGVSKGSSVYMSPSAGVGGCAA